MFLCKNVLCKLLFISLVVGARAIENQDEKKLLGVAVVFRHGDRAPISSYPNDPYHEAKYWPEGYGQLTKQGIRRQYDLGAYLRARYEKFLPKKFVVGDIKVLSSDVPRTIMSASANLAGLWPPTTEEIFVDGLPWQPIPIHTLDQSTDTIISVSKQCPKFERMYRELCESDEFKQLARKYSSFYTYISKYTTWNITDISTFQGLYTTMYVYEMHNRKYLPYWYTAMSAEERDLLKSLAGLSFSRETYTKELQRFKTGPFFSYLFNHFNSIITNVGPKFLIFSAHDGTIASILNTLGAYDQNPPEFASTVIFELFEDKSGLTKINAYHKLNVTDEARDVIIEGCDFNCDFSKLKKILEPITVDDITHDKECIDTV